jgi:hypothetical protein
LKFGFPLRLNFWLLLFKIQDNRSLASVLDQHHKKW